MLTGYNTDIKVDGDIYHIQTEDGGTGNPVIVTLLYSKGAILSSRKTSYADIVKVDRFQNVVRGLMEEQHKAMIKELREGKFRNPSAGAEKEEVIGKKDEGKKEEPKKEKSLDDMILEYLSKGE